MELESSHPALCRLAESQFSINTFAEGLVAIMQVDQALCLSGSSAIHPNYLVVKEPVSAPLEARCNSNYFSQVSRMCMFAAQYAAQADPSAGYAHLEGDKSHSRRQTAQFTRDIVTSRINIGDLRHG